jgi:hypothetical protein
MQQTKVIGSSADNERKRKDFRACNCKRSNCLKVHWARCMHMLLTVYIILTLFYIPYSCTVNVLRMPFTAYRENVIATTVRTIKIVRSFAKLQLNTPWRETRWPFAPKSWGMTLSLKTLLVAYKVTIRVATARSRIV